MKKIFFDPSQALLNLFGEEAALSEHALIHFTLPLPGDPAKEKKFVNALQEEFEKLDVTGTRISHKNEQIQVSIPVSAMYILDLKFAEASPESKELAKILSVFRDTHTPLAVEIPVRPGDHTHDIENLNAHFDFDPPMKQAQNTQTPAITLGADSFNTLLDAWLQAAPHSASQEVRASELDALLDHRGVGGGSDEIKRMIAHDLLRAESGIPSPRHEGGFAERVGKERSNGDVIPFRRE